jgi:hypothetical protein
MKKRQAVNEMMERLKKLSEDLEALAFAIETQRSKFGDLAIERSEIRRPSYTRIFRLSDFHVHLKDTEGHLWRGICQLDNAIGALAMIDHDLSKEEA